MKFSYKKVLYVIISIILLLSLIYISNQYDSKQISDFISKAGILAPILYISIQIVGQIFAPLSTTALFVAGFILFGKMAILYAIITWLVSSITNFYLARHYGKNVIKFFLGEDGVDRVEKLAKRIDNRTFFILRISTFYINDFTSYAFGLTNISFKRYYIATIVSILPWSIIISLIVREGETLLSTTIKLLLSMIPFVLVSYLYLKKVNKK